MIEFYKAAITFIIDALFVIGALELAFVALDLIRRATP
jgi:hypothetical protein